MNGAFTISSIGDTVANNLQLSGLTASKPVFTDASKNLVSGAYPIPQIVASGNLTSKTTAQSSVATFTTPNDATVHTFRLGSYIKLASVSGGAVSVQCDFTDESGTGRNFFFYPPGASSPQLQATGFYGNATVTIRSNPNTAITIKTVFAGAPTTNYDVGGTIERMY
jgi:hypothetical protein